MKQMDMTEILTRLLDETEASLDMAMSRLAPAGLTQVGQAVLELGWQALVSRQEHRVRREIKYAPPRRPASQQTVTRAAAIVRELEAWERWPFRGTVLADATREMLEQDIVEKRGAIAGLGGALHFEEALAARMTRPGQKVREAMTIDEWDAIRVASFRDKE